MEGSVGHGDPVPPSAIDLDIVQCLEACPMLDVSVIVTIFISRVVFIFVHPLQDPQLFDPELVNQLCAAEDLWADLQLPNLASSIDTTPQAKILPEVSRLRTYPGVSLISCL